MWWSVGSFTLGCGCPVSHFHAEKSIADHANEIWPRRFPGIPNGETAQDQITDLPSSFALLISNYLTTTTLLTPLPHHETSSHPRQPVILHYADAFTHQPPSLAVTPREFYSRFLSFPPSHALPLPNPNQFHRDFNYFWLETSALQHTA